MGKFFKLVQNEYIKILNRISTWIILGLVVLAALGLCLVSVLVKNEMNRNNDTYSQSTYTDGMYDSEIAYQKDSKPEGYEQMIEALEFLRDNKIPYADWRYTAANDMAQVKTQLASASASGLDDATVKALTKTAQDYKNAILAKDWKAYYQIKIDVIQEDASLSKEEKEMQEWQYQYRLGHDLKPGSDWKSNLITETATLKAQVASMRKEQESGTAQDMEKLNQNVDKIQANLYRIEHNIRLDIASAGLTHPQGTLGFWDVFSTSSKMISVISLLIIVIAGSCVASEFSSGTIKFLLINPVKRGKILFSKYVMVVSFAYLMLLFFFILNALFCMMFYGTGDLGIPYLSVAGGTVHSTPGFAYIAGKYLLASVDILVMATLAFAISSLIRSSALAIGVGAFAMLGGNTLILILKQALNLDWARYLIFANTNLSSIMDGSSLFAHQSVQFALIVVAVHMFVFLLTAWDGFVRREV